MTHPEIRFWAKVSSAPALDCWNWTGARDSRGYGRFYLGDRVTIAAHRYAYQNMRGEVPDDLHLDHLCVNPSCVNPWHLEPVTQAINTRRWADSITSCPVGHSYTPSNTRRDARGLRRCRRCDADRAYERRGARSPRRRYADFTPQLFAAAKNSTDPFGG